MFKFLSNGKKSECCGGGDKSGDHAESSATEKSETLDTPATEEGKKAKGTGGCCCS